MQNFGNNISRTSILNELSGGVAELGEAFALILNDMVVQSGITNPKAETFEIVQCSWKKLAEKPDKTPEDIKKLDEDLKDEIYTLAKSYLLYMAKIVRNTTGKIEYAQYEDYMLSFRFGHYDITNKPEYINKVKIQIKNAFNKISAHGETTGDNLIDKHDMAAFIYALSMKSQRNGDKFSGFTINGIIEPETYAVCEKQLFTEEDNLINTKLRIAYKILNGLL